MSLTQRIIDACKNPKGFSISELAAETNDTAESCNTIAGILVRSGRLYKGGVIRYFRYFTNKADADAWDLVAEDDRKTRMKETQKRIRQRKAERARTGKPAGRPTVVKVEKPKKVKKKRSEIVLRRTDTVKPSAKPANIIWPEHVKVLVHPTPPGRFEFEPPKGWVGQISKDQMARRMQNVSAV